MASYIEHSEPLEKSIPTIIFFMFFSFFVIHPLSFRLSFICLPSEEDNILKENEKYV